MAVVAVTAHVVTEAIAVAVMVAMQVVVVTSTAKSAAHAWADPAFRAQRDVEHAQEALRKLAAQAHGEALTQLLGAWQARDAEQLPSAQQLAGKVTAPACVPPGPARLLLRPRATRLKLCAMAWKWLLTCSRLQTSWLHVAL